MSDLFVLISGHGLAFGFLVGFIAWALGKGLSVGLHLFEL